MKKPPEVIQKRIWEIISSHVCQHDSGIDTCVGLKSESDYWLSNVNDTLYLIQGISSLMLTATWYEAEGNSSDSFQMAGGIKLRGFNSVFSVYQL